MYRPRTNRTLFVCLAATVLLICGMRTQATAQTFTVRNDHFRLDPANTAQDKFLIFISYFDAMDAGAHVDTDFDYIKNTLHVDGVRIFPNWWDFSCTNPHNLPCYSASTLMASTSLRSGKLTTLQNVLASARSHGLLVDLSFARETVCDTTGSTITTCPSGQTLSKDHYTTLMTQVLNALNSSAYDHVFVDLQNEFDNTDPDTTNTDETQQLTPADVGALVAALRPTIGPRFLTASATSLTSYANTASLVQNQGLDISAFHDPRGSGWQTATSSVVTQLRNAFTSSGWALRPVYLQEPTPWEDDVATDPANNDFVTAVKNAKTSGAAAWTFFTRASFVLTGSTAFSSRLTSIEAQTIANLRGAADSVSWGACVASLSPTSQTIAGPGGAFSVAVTIPAECSWTTSSPVSWITVSPGSAGSPVTVTVAQNPNPGTRSATLTIADQSFTVTQGSCALTFGPTTFTEWPSVRTDSLTVTAPSGCAWMASSDTPSWLTITSGSVGTGSGTVTFSTTANHAWTARTAHISINGANATVTQARRWTPLDFDGDGKADLAIYRPSDGSWHVLGSSNAYTASIIDKTYGVSTDIPLLADFDGDGKSDLAIYRPTDGSWHVLASSNGYTASIIDKSYGLSTDIPVPGDFDGDGKADLAIYRPSDGSWHVLASSNGYTASIIDQSYGLSTDVPVPGDFDGDGKADLAIYRPSDGSWHVLGSSNGYTASVLDKSYGAPNTDVPVPADFDGDGRTDLAIYRPSDGSWHVLASSNGYTASIIDLGYGVSTDLPAPTDFDGDGHADLAIYRPADGSWHVLGSTNGYTASVLDHTYGASGDIPLRPRF